MWCPDTKRESMCEKSPAARRRLGARGIQYYANHPSDEGLCGDKVSVNCWGLSECQCCLTVHGGWLCPCRAYGRRQPWHDVELLDGWKTTTTAECDPNRLWLHVGW